MKVLNALVLSFLLIGGTQFSWRFVERNTPPNMIDNFQNGGVQALTS